MELSRLNWNIHVMETRNVCHKKYDLIILAVKHYPYCSVSVGSASTSFSICILSSVFRYKVTGKTTVLLHIMTCLIDLIALVVHPLYRCR